MISVVLPIFEEELAIQELIPQLIGVLNERGGEFEVIAVDDGSKDATAEVLRDLHKQFPAHLRVARHLHNRGNGAALRTGIRLSAGHIVVTMDSDGQHAPEDIAQLVAEIPPYDLVVASRLEGYRGPWHRNLANAIFNRFASWLTRRKIQDLTSGFRAMRRDIAQHFLPLFPEGFSAPTTTTMAFLKAGYNVGFIPVHVRQRSSGTSKIRIWEDGARFIMLILRMIMLFDPLRIFLPTGFALGILGTLAWVAGLLNAGRLVVPNSAIFMFTAALITWLLGLVADQLSNTRIQYRGDESIELLEQSRPDRADPQ
jgi:glycosyltransferase involved in cell wall biosynthesis